MFIEIRKEAKKNKNHICLCEEGSLPQSLCGAAVSAKLHYNIADWGTAVASGTEWCVSCYSTALQSMKANKTRAEVASE